MARASLFDPAEYDAAVVEVPDDLIDIPTGDKEAHQEWIIARTEGPALSCSWGAAHSLAVGSESGLYLFELLP